MSIATDIYSRLSGYAGFIALVGTKIYPSTTPDNTELPYVTYSRISDTPEHAMGSDADIKTVRMQVGCWSETFSECKSIETQVKAALSRYRAGNIKDCLLDGSMDLFDPEEVYHIPIDFIVFYDGD